MEEEGRAAKSVTTTVSNLVIEHCCRVIHTRPHTFICVSRSPLQKGV